MQINTTFSAFALPAVSSLTFMEEIIGQKLLKIFILSKKISQTDVNTILRYRNEHQLLNEK